MATQPYCEEALSILVSRIKRSANQAGISTVRDMALASGVSKSGIDKIYNLKSYPCFDTLLAIANACNCTVLDWMDALIQLPEGKGKRPESRSESTSNPVQRKRKPKGQNRNANGMYECFKCGKEHKTAKQVNACFNSHIESRVRAKKYPCSVCKTEHSTNEAANACFKACREKEKAQLAKLSPRKSKPSLLETLQGMKPV